MEPAEIMQASADGVVCGADVKGGEGHVVGHERATGIVFVCQGGSPGSVSPLWTLEGEASLQKLHGDWVRKVSHSQGNNGPEQSKSIKCWVQFPGGRGKEICDRGMTPN